MDWQLILLCFLLVAHTSSHSHEDEPPLYKYSRDANTKSSDAIHDHHTKPSIGLQAAANPQQVWIDVVGAVIVISVIPFVLLALVPDLNKRRGLLKTLLGFAAGGLLGDSFLHIIPHALSSEHDRVHGHSHAEITHHHDQVEHGHHHRDHTRHLFVGLWVVAGIMAFLCIEKLVRLFQQNGHTHSHQTSSGSQTDVRTSQGKSKQKKVINGDTVTNNEKKQTKTKKKIKAAGYLNLAADFTHNFTDGLAIGASFLINRNVGFVTTFTVLIHELPHEIGDYAILIQSGCSARKAMMLQLVTAFGALLGASLSLLTAGVGLSSIGIALPVEFLSVDLITSSVLPFTAGGFIYIAMTSVLPDLLGDVHSSEPGQSKGTKLTQSLFELSAMMAGTGMMAAISLVE